MGLNDFGLRRNDSELGRNDSELGRNDFELGRNDLGAMGLGRNDLFPGRANVHLNCFKKFLTQKLYVTCCWVRIDWRVGYKLIESEYETCEPGYESSGYGRSIVRNDWIPMKNL